jgi:hypothetical protein
MLNCNPVTFAEDLVQHRTVDMQTHLSSGQANSID